jgi:hypothetical protein
MGMEYPKYERCPNCGSGQGSYVLKCKKCGKLYCFDCGRTTHSIRCPKCDTSSNDSNNLGEVGKPYYDPS